jgi:hypothetical protein
MDQKDQYSQAFLKAAGHECNDQLAISKRTVWWYNVRTKNSGGLRLTDEGIEFVVNEAKLKTYNIKFPKDVKITPQILIWLDQFIKSPFHITKKDITVLTEVAAFELYLFSGDVQKMGYSKALAKRFSQV